MRALAFFVLASAGCFSEPPRVVDATTSTGTTAYATSTSSASGVADATTTSETGASFCDAYGGALACDDFEAGEVQSEWMLSAGLDGDVVEVSEPGRDSAYGLHLQLAGVEGSAATIELEHTHDAVVQRFALQLSADCNPPERGVVLASYAAFPEVGDLPVDTARLELVLLPEDRLGLRRRAAVQEMSAGTIAAPPRDAWVEVVFTVSLSATAFEGEVAIADATLSQTFGGLTVGNGRRSRVGLESPGAAATCSAAIDDVLLVAP